MGLLLTSSGEIYIGCISIQEETNPNSRLEVNFTKYETPKKVVGLDKNIVKYSDNSFGYLDFTVNYEELQQNTSIPFEEKYKFEELNVDNLSNEIIFRLLNGAYVVDCVKNSSGDVCELSDINISNVEYIICGSLSVYGFDTPYNRISI